MPLKDELAAIIHGEILDDAESLEKYSHDASIFQIKPQLIVYPKDSTDIKSLVKFAATHDGISLTPRSAGTDMSGGAIGESVVLDMTRYFNQIKDIGQDYAITQPGVYYRDFEKATLAKGLLLPCYPASREINTVGGMAANNSAGEKTLRFGQTVDFVESLKVILADGNEYEFKQLDKQALDKKIAQKDFEGEIYRQINALILENEQLIQNAKPKVHKNSAGYQIWDVWDGKSFNLAKLFVGSQGTLGVITEIKYRLIRPKPLSKLLVIFLYNLDHLGEIVNNVLKYEPESFESYDDQTLKFASRFLPEVLNVIKPRNILSLMLGFIPEALMVLQHGFPKLVLMAEFTGEIEDEVKQRCLQAQESIKNFHLKSRITTDEDDARKYWVIRRESFNLFRHHAIGDQKTAPFIDDIIVKPETLPEFLPKLQNLLQPYKKDMLYTIAGHIGDGNLHIIPLMKLSDDRHRAIIPELSRKVYDLVFEFKGSMTAEHNDGLVRGPFLEQMFGEDVYQLFKEIKSIFDPKNIFNPHKKTDATFEYVYNHIAPSSV